MTAPADRLVMPFPTGWTQAILSGGQLVQSTTPVASGGLLFNVATSPDGLSMTVSASSIFLKPAEARQWAEVLAAAADAADAAATAAPTDGGGEA